MPSPNMRVPTETLDTLRQLAQETGTSMQEVLELAVDRFRRQVLLNLANQSYAALQASGELREASERERAARGILEQDRFEREQRSTKPAAGTSHHSASS